MLNCSGDPLENYLAPFGYSVVVLPRADIRPLQLKAPQSSRRLEDIGSLETSFSVPHGSNLSLPPIASAPTMDLQGESSRKLKVGIGLKLFGNALAAIGLSPLGLSAGFENAATISFRFGGVIRDSVEFAAVDAWLKQADLTDTGPSVKALLEAGSLYVILAVLRASIITISAEDSAGREAAIDVSALSALFGGNLKINPSDKSKSTVSIDTGQPLAFGVKAARISMKGDSYTGIAVPGPGEVVLEAASLFPHEPEPALPPPDVVF